MVEILQGDPPRKTHMVAERIDESTVKTECGYTFEQPGLGPLHTFTFHPEKDKRERRYNLPEPEARCGKCPWDELD